ncbi:MAG: hypothetical protein ACFBSF_06115 [Leptolyngbyaceae cyanobacterium]
MHSDHKKFLKPAYDIVPNPTYCRLEGFDSSDMNASEDIVTVSDVINQASRKIAAKKTNHDWLHGFLTVGIIFGLLSASSITLGLAASRVALCLEYLGGDVIGRMVESQE